uniref:Uncharacterized protein n=1 Tax=Panagrolaimus sp. ES5 TaxID=591445 RepID=A0AC34GED1_9BILA
MLEEGIVNENQLILFDCRGINPISNSAVYVWLDQVIYDPSKLIHKAKEFFQKFDYIHSAECLWAAVVSAVKELFLPFGIHSSSHQSIEHLCLFAINKTAWDETKRESMKESFNNSEEFHKIFYNKSRYSRALFKKKMDDLAEFVQCFVQIPSLSLKEAVEAHVQELLNGVTFLTSKNHCIQIVEQKPPGHSYIGSKS